jgi:hypothetical protein
MEIQARKLREKMEEDKQKLIEEVPKKRKGRAIMFKSNNAPKQNNDEGNKQDNNNELEFIRLFQFK